MNILEQYMQLLGTTVLTYGDYFDSYGNYDSSIEYTVNSILSARKVDRYEYTSNKVFFVGPRQSGKTSRIINILLNLMENPNNVDIFFLYNSDNGYHEVGRSLRYSWERKSAYNQDYFSSLNNRLFIINSNRDPLRLRGLDMDHREKIFIVDNAFTINSTVLYDLMGSLYLDRDKEFNIIAAGAYESIRRDPYSRRKTVGDDLLKLPLIDKQVLNPIGLIGMIREESMATFINTLDTRSYMLNDRPYRPIMTNSDIQPF